MTKKAAVIIFTRNPTLGKVKTRLAKSIGNEKALLVYKDLLRHTQNVVKQVECERFLFYSEAIIAHDTWSNKQFHKTLQQGTDLGERMLHAFTTVFEKGFDKVLIIGSDIYDLQPKHLEEAFEALTPYDFVIGPAEDGGYYLLGMKKLREGVFQSKQWGTSSVFKATMNDLKGFKVHQLEVLNDIDTLEDLKKSNYAK